MLIDVLASKSHAFSIRRACSQLPGVSPELQPAEGRAEVPATELEEARHLCKAQSLIQPLDHVSRHSLHLPRRKAAGSVTGTLS